MILKRLHFLSFTAKLNATIKDLNELDEKFSRLAAAIQGRIHMNERTPPAKFSHTILTVGNIPKQSQDVGPLLQHLGIAFTHVKTADQALEAVNNHPVPFSLVISDQRLEGMKGTALFAHIKGRSPGTIRFLLTRYSDMQTIISAVNTGAVHKYISMPWDETQLSEAVAWGLMQYEHHLENQTLLTLATQQNDKLYELDCTLMEIGREHDKASKALEGVITALKAALKEKTINRPMSAKKLAALLVHILENTDTDPKKLLDHLYRRSITNLYADYTNFSMENDIQMTPLKTEDIHDG